ncbi:cAMP-specific 3',5'-cyclic phosphodiesterase 4D-like [Platysternon megacephalum]|uniref:Galectin n=1 Tax=Platysternon megacephalum TaxID=55544 RepID=A0A4D9EAP3_9SAUR|nr:cAMP-specific 3',5'-cyclic phosphodiesterase 4D-like [Platysternon megacephalum]
MSEKFEILNLDVKAGDTLKIKGKVANDAENFVINLGKSPSELGLHFNPRFKESTIICNSKCANCWQSEHRDNHLPFSRGSEVKFIVSFLGDKFKVKLPDGHEVEFPNRHGYDKISYLSVQGGFKVISFKQE